MIGETWLIRLAKDPKVHKATITNEFYGMDGTHYYTRDTYYNVTEKNIIFLNKARWWNFA